MPLRSPIGIEGLGDLVALGFSYDPDNPTKYTEAFSFWCLRQVRNLEIQGFYWEQSTEADNALLISQLETLRQGGQVNDWGQSLLLPGGVLAAGLAGLTMAGVMPATLAIQVGVELLCALFGAGGGKTDIQPIVDKMEEFHDLWRNWRGNDPFGSMNFASMVSNTGTSAAALSQLLNQFIEVFKIHDGAGHVSVLAKALLSGTSGTNPVSYFRSGLHEGSPEDTEEGNATLESVLGRILADFVLRLETRGGNEVSVSVGNVGLTENP